MSFIFHLKIVEHIDDILVDISEIFFRVKISIFNLEEK